MIKAMIESVARITTVRGKHSGEFRRAACTLHVALSKPQRAEEHPRAFETASRRCTTRTGGRKDRRTEGQKDGRTEAQIDRSTNSLSAPQGQEDGRTEAQKDGSTDRQTDNPRNGQPEKRQPENNPTNGQPENRTSGPTTRAMPRGAELPCPRSRRPPSHCPAAVHELSRLPW